MPRGERGSVCHTNHALKNDDRNELFADNDFTDSRQRLQALETRLAGAIEGEGEIEAALRSKDSDAHPVCRTVAPGKEFFTFGSTIMTLSNHPSLQVTMGPPDANPYRRFDFSVIH